MPTYELLCEKCEKSFEVIHSIHENLSDWLAATHCEFCQSKQIRQLFGDPFCIVKDIKTVGQLADANTKKLGSGELSERKEKQKIKQRRGRPKPKRYWDKVNLQEIKDVKKYILEGKKS